MKNHSECQDIIKKLSSTQLINVSDEIREYCLVGHANYITKYPNPNIVNLFDLTQVLEGVVINNEINEEMVNRFKKQYLY